MNLSMNQKLEKLVFLCGF
ncbi:hypothetical protein D5K91_01850 [Arcobacter butzleri]|nr:hypothetical protein [Aliarcobacter butzleri]